MSSEVNTAMFTEPLEVADVQLIGPTDNFVLVKPQE